MKLSIVSTMYLSAPFLKEFCSRVSAAASSITADWELVLVNDGSPDSSLDLALSIQKDLPELRIVDLSRNFGHHTAIVAGLEAAVGDFVFLIDCDLEEQPEWLPDFQHQMMSKDVDVVYGVQERRVASAFSNILGELYWKAINIASDVAIPSNPMTCRLMSRRYVDALLQVEDHVLYLAGVFSWAGFAQEPLLRTKTPRPRGISSTYSLAKKLLLVADSFSSFSIAPLLFVFMSGMVIWLLSIVYGVYLLLLKLFDSEAVLSGYTSLSLSIWFIGGMTIMSLGIVGLYIGKIFREVKRRPRYLVKDIHG